MFYLPLSLDAWDSNDFKTIIKKEVCSIDPNLLPLQQGLSQSSYAISDSLSVSIISMHHNNDYLLIKTGLFYTGVISGCNCADDPTPVVENQEYCETLFCIDKKTAETTVTLID
ncbi:MAG: hypothetical protein JKX75_00930 [Gammaproteobacteria bacterium]|nr:hypothetical protein [Gammaproteobacteria bacterium]